MCIDVSCLSLEYKIYAPRAHLRKGALGPHYYYHRHYYYKMSQQVYRPRFVHFRSESVFQPVSLTSTSFVGCSGTYSRKGGGEGKGGGVFAEGIIRVGGSGGMTAGFTRPSETGRTPGRADLSEHTSRPWPAMSQLKT